MKKSVKKDHSRRVLARSLAEDLRDVHGLAIETSLDGPAADEVLQPSSPLSEAATSESIPD